MLNFLPRLFEQGRELKSFHFERTPQCIFDHCTIAHVGHSMSFHPADAKNYQNGMVFAREYVSAQNIERHNRKRSSDFREEVFPIPGAKTCDAVSQFGKGFPAYRGCERALRSDGGVLEERAKQL